MSKVTAYYHIVFCTKGRRMTIPLQYKNDLYRFLWHHIQDHKCELLRIGGIQNHIHLLINLHPSISLSELMQLLKGRSSGWLRSDSRFPDFDGWAADYYACSISPDNRDSVIEYIKNQETHHLHEDTENELIKVYKMAGLIFDDRDLM